MHCGDCGFLVERDSVLEPLYILVSLLSATGAVKTHWERSVVIATRGSSTDTMKFPNCLPEPRREIARRKTELAGRPQGKKCGLAETKARIHSRQRDWTAISNDASKGWLILEKRNNHWPMKLKAVVMTKVMKWKSC